MPRFYFHLRDGTDVLLDPEGVQLAGLEAVRGEAMRAARDTLAHGLQDGMLDLRPRIDIESADGVIVHSLALAVSFRTIAAAV